MPFVPWNATFQRRTKTHNREAPTFSALLGTIQSAHSAVKGASQVQCKQFLLRARLKLCKNARRPVVSYPPEKLQLVDIDAERKFLWESAQNAVARRAGSTLYRGDGVRQTLVVILSGEEMGEHESPQEGFLHVIEGKIRLHGKDRSWDIAAGQLFPVPPEKHSVTALEDTVLTLTVLRQSIMNP